MKNTLLSPPIYLPIYLSIQPLQLNRCCIMHPPFNPSPFSLSDFGFRAELEP